MRKASASGRDYFRHVAAANARLELAKPPASLEEVFERLEHMEDRLGDLGHARESDPGAATRLRIRPALSDSDTSTRRELIAGRYQDLADIEAILDAGVAVDASYVERWAEFWEVLDRWRAFTR